MIRTEVCQSDLLSHVFLNLTTLVESSITSCLLLHDCDSARTCTGYGLKPAGNLDVIFEDIWVLGVASLRPVRPSASHQTHMSVEIHTLHQCVRVLWGESRQIPLTNEQAASEYKAPVVGKFTHKMKHTFFNLEISDCILDASLQRI